MDDKVNKHLFVDLEETLIDSWESGQLGPKGKVWSLLDTHFGRDRPVTNATVWSFAVWDQKDVDHFNNNFKTWLENQFNLRFVDVVTTAEMVVVCKNHLGWNHLDTTELIQLLGKERSLEIWLKNHNYRDCEVVLLDDVVENKTVHFHDKNLTLNFVKV